MGLDRFINFPKTSANIKGRHKAMALNKVVLALAIAAMVLMASTVPAAMADDGDFDCYCDCMKNKCMKVPKTTKEECAPACSDGCVEAGYRGQPNPDDFCGLLNGIERSPPCTRPRARVPSITSSLFLLSFLFFFFFFFFTKCTFVMNS